MPNGHIFYSGCSYFVIRTQTEAHYQVNLVFSYLYFSKVHGWLSTPCLWTNKSFGDQRQTCLPYVDVNVDINPIIFWTKAQLVYLCRCECWSESYIFFCTKAQLFYLCRCERWIQSYLQIGFHHFSLLCRKSSSVFYHIVIYCSSGAQLPKSCCWTI